MFTKSQRSSFKYTFAHWCAYQMTALNLGVWKFKYLFHDIEKPWMLKWYCLFYNRETAYAKVQEWHRMHNKHHITYWTSRTFDPKVLKKLDFDAMIIDWECSRLTKAAAPLTAKETLPMIVQKLKDGEYNYMIGNYVIEPLEADITFFETIIKSKLNKLKLTK